MFQAAGVYEAIKHVAEHYEIHGNADSFQFDWTTFKEKRDKYIVRLNNIYLNGLKNAGVTVMDGWASFVDAHTVHINHNDGSSSQVVTAQYILIAVGGKPMVPPGEGVVEHSITSDGFFELTKQPKKVVVVGAGYIAVE